MQQLISQKKLPGELGGGAGKKSSSPPITDIGHNADEHGPTTNTRDAPAGPARKGIRIEKKAGPILGLGGRGGQRPRNGGGLNIGGY